MTSTDPRRAPGRSTKSSPPDQDALSNAERELYGGRLRYDMAFVRHEGPLTRLSFRRLAAALPHTVVLVLRTGWRADRRATAGLVLAQLGQGVSAAWALIAVNSVLGDLFAQGPTGERLREALPALGGLGAVAVLGALLTAWSTAMSGRLEPQVERAVAARYYRAVTRVEFEATQRPEVQRVLEAGRFGTNSACGMLRLSVGVGNVLLGMVAAAAVLVSLHWLLLPMLLLIALPKGWGAVRSARRDYVSKFHWIDHRRAIASLLGFLTRPQAQAEIRVHAAGTKLLTSYEEMSHQTEREQRRLARAQAATDLAAGAMAGVASLTCYGLLWWLLTEGLMPLAVGGTAVLAIRLSTARLAALVQQINQLYEELLYLTDTEDAIAIASANAIPTAGTPLPLHVDEVRVENVSYTYPGSATPALRDVSVRVRRGQVTALVGANGSGKSSLVKIMSGLLLTAEGEGDVRWADTGSGHAVSVRDADRAAVFAQVGLLAQDFPRWEMTAAANVAIGAGDRVRDMDRVKSAAGTAHVLPLIEGLPHGWNSIACKGFERGVEFSGGEWQKLGTARSLYRAAPFLLVDEPTSALDPHAEIAAFQGLWSLAEEGHAVVLVTHRLAATANADRIYVLDRGRVAEEGTHEQLMDRPDGIYRSMFSAQAAQYGTPAPGVPSQAAPRPLPDTAADGAGQRQRPSPA
ncbi:ATP-binding cassette domain-containing protein [Streptomyces californicus]|uniref:ATP-binding cassette domain-containing protein n=1 Tax=Streptomyces californicus TaxID=67351 RepID=UPI0037A14E01